MKYYLASFSIGLIIGVAFSFLFCASLNNAPPQKPLAKIATELKKQVTKSELVYSKAADSLKVQREKLQLQLRNTKFELTKAKDKNHSFRLAIYDLIDKQPESRLLESSSANSDCDSLIVMVEQLMQSSAEKDSLFETVTINLEDQVKNKDSTIAVKDKQYRDIKSAFDKSIQSTNELSTLNKQLTKQVTRQKIKSKLLTATLIILAGAATDYIIHH